MSGLTSWQFEPLISLLGPIHQSVFLHLLQHSLIQAVWRASVPTLLYLPSYVLMSGDTPFPMHGKSAGAVVSMLSPLQHLLSSSELATSHPLLQDGVQDLQIR